MTDNELNAYESRPMSMDVPVLVAEVRRLREQLATARAEALEEAAREVEGYRGEYDGAYFADEIRALATAPAAPIPTVTAEVTIEEGGNKR